MEGAEGSKGVHPSFVLLEVKKVLKVPLNQLEKAANHKGSNVPTGRFKSKPPQFTPLECPYDDILDVYFFICFFFTFSYTTGPASGLSKIELEFTFSGPLFLRI